MCWAPSRHELEWRRRRAHIPSAAVRETRHPVEANAWSERKWELGSSVQASKAAVLKMLERPHRRLMGMDAALH